MLDIVASLLLLVDVVDEANGKAVVDKLEEVVASDEVVMVAEIREEVAEIDVIVELEVISEPAGRFLRTVRSRKGVGVQMMISNTEIRYDRYHKTVKPESHCGGSLLILVL